MKQKEEFQNVNDVATHLTIYLQQWQIEKIKKIAENNKPIPVTVNMTVRYIISDWLKKNKEI